MYTASSGFKTKVSVKCIGRAELKPFGVFKMIVLIYLTVEVNLNYIFFVFPYFYIPLIALAEYF